MTDETTGAGTRATTGPETRMTSGATPRDATIFVIASYMRDVSVAVDAFPRPGETRVGTDSLESSGGKGSNQAIQAARCGARVCLAAAVARDAAGEAAQALWRAEGIDTAALQVRDAGSTGLAVILVNAQGENQIVIAPGVNASLGVPDLEAAASRIRAARLVVAQLETPIATTIAGFALARAAGVTTLLNTAPAPATLPQDLWSLTDILVANEIEASTLAGLPVDADPREIAAALLARVRVAVVITLGARGAMLMLKSGEHLRADAPRVDVVDSTGAGDAFVGAFAASWAGSYGGSGANGKGDNRAQSLAARAQAALQHGVAAGSLACTRRGVVPALARRDEIVSLVASSWSTMRL